MDIQERRQTTRWECCYQVAACYQGNSYELSVVDMGLGGMRLLLPAGLDSLAVRSELALSTREAPGEVGVKVVWCRSGEAGVHYSGRLEDLRDSWVSACLQRLGFEDSRMYERRRHIRFRNRGGFAAHLTLPDESRVAARLLDLGLGGALLECSGPQGQSAGLRVGLSVDRLEGPPVLGRVVYWNGQRCGLRFEELAEARLLEGYLTAMKAYQA